MPEENLTTIDDAVRRVDPPLGNGQQAVAWEVVGQGRWAGRHDWIAEVIGIREQPRGRVSR